jgi:hypothetical protein
MTERSRQLAGDNLTQIAVDYTRPVYLIQMVFPTGTTYISSGIQISFDGNVYPEGQVSVNTFRWDADGTQEGSITLSNESNIASALILAGTVNDIEIIIYKTYLIAGGGNTTPEFYVRGAMDGTSLSPEKAVIGVLSTTSRTAFVPNRYHTMSEGFNWLPVSGETIMWGDEAFILVEER